MSEEKKSDKKKGNYVKKGFYYGSGLAAFTQSPLRRTISTVIGALKHKRETVQLCPACCQGGLHDYHIKQKVVVSDDDDDDTKTETRKVFAGWHCDHCGLLVKSKERDYSKLLNFIDEHGRQLYEKHGGRDHHMNDVGAIDDKYNKAVMLLYIAVGISVLFFYFLAKAMTIPVLLLLLFLIYLLMMSMSSAFAGYVRYHGLMYLNNKELFIEWIKTHHINYWHNPITAELKQAEEEGLLTDDDLSETEVESHDKIEIEFKK